MTPIPSGTITFLFTDIEGSTRLWQEYPDRMKVNLASHERILRKTIEHHGGYVFKTVGDAFCAAFSTAMQGIQAAIEAQQSLSQLNHREAGIRVRMGLHTGNAEERDNDYFGTTLNRVARLMSAGYGGQILLSLATHELITEKLPNGVAIRDLGEHRLKDLIHPERIFQLDIAGLPTEFPPIKTLEEYRHNLPAQITSFIGRGKEITAIKKTLENSRLVTMTGFGGTGKTRLSVQVAGGLLDKFGDGIWFVDLAPLSEAALIPQTIAAALNVHEEGTTSLMEVLVNYVRRREMLIVLDNCEHLIEASAFVAVKLLHAAPLLKILATSREGLGVPGEAIFSVPSLSLPEMESMSPELLLHYEAVQLFIDRAIAVKNDFIVTNTNAPMIGQICNRLDGIPLAIELAAARIKAMTPTQIATRLDDRFRLLINGSRTLLPRQQTLRALIDWSWDLLSNNERALLRRVSIFAGGWTLEAAEAVCAGGGIDQVDILDLLAQLVDKSLVVWNVQQDEPRYHLLETIRQYAQGQLNAANETGEAEQTSRHHANFFACLAEAAEKYAHSPELMTWAKRLNIEKDNVRVAMEWAIDSSPQTALRINHALMEFWLWQGFFTEGIEWSLRVLDANPDAPPSKRAYLHSWICIFAVETGRSDMYTQYGKTALELARQSQDNSELALALFAYGAGCLEGGDPQSAYACISEALPLAHASQAPFVLPGVLLYLGMMGMYMGEYAEADALLLDAIKAARYLFTPLFETMGLWISGHLAFLCQDYAKARNQLHLGRKLAQDYQQQHILAHIQEMSGRLQIVDADLVGARSSFDQSFTMLQDMALKPCLGHGLEGWARLALAKGDYRRAARLLSALVAYMKNLGMNMLPIEQTLYEQTLAAVQQQLAPPTFQEEWQVGEMMNLEQAIALAMVDLPIGSGLIIGDK